MAGMLITARLDSAARATRLRSTVTGYVSSCVHVDENMTHESCDMYL